MNALIDRMLALWEKPHPSRAEARAFATVYAEQMSLNGQPLSLDGLIVDIWMMASDLSVLMQLGAVTRLAGPTGRG